jgi:DNA-binding NarL/FixJ family response regulator
MVSRIVIADDHEIVRKGLVSLLAAHPNWQVSGEASDGRDAVEMVAKLKPHVVILDIGMPSLNGLEATRQILKDSPDTRVLVLTLHDSDQLIREVLNAGARGFLLKSDAARDLVAAVEALLRDKTYFTSKVADMVLGGYLNRSGTPMASRSHHLTSREREVVQLIAEGRSTKEVAVALGMSVKTAETHRSNIMRKLQIHSVSDLVMYAVRNDIVHVAEPLASAPVVAAD